MKALAEGSLQRLPSYTGDEISIYVRLLAQYPERQSIPALIAVVKVRSLMLAKGELVETADGGHTHSIYNPRPIYSEVGDAVLKCSGGKIGKIRDRFTPTMKQMVPPEVAEWKAWWEKHKDDKPVVPQ